MAHKSDEDKNKIIQLYLESGKSITEFCKLEISGTTGVTTLLGWLEDKSYKMTLSDSDSELESKIKQLENELLEMTLKYEKSELLEAMRLVRNS